ncbi:MAG: FAD:protein FMN transferase [Chloroflexi bacterium]|nr:FAD:protein FMN transferase [Chloroflexota bacterium]
MGLEQMPVDTSRRPAAPRLSHAFTSVSMDTGITIQVVTTGPRDVVEADVQRALAWFETVERICTRFDPGSEVMQLLNFRVGEAVKVSTLLFEAVAFAVDLAEQSDGAFDPTLGAYMEGLGFNTNYRTGEIVQTPVSAGSGSYRDVKLDRRRRTIRLRRPVILDLNAVAKGLAIDLAARELQRYEDVCIEAGGDLYVRGHNADGESWRVGIQHPRAASVLVETLHVSDAAVCTSGDYERPGHLVDGRTRVAREDVASVTVVAPTAMAADGLSTTALVLGRERGLAFLAQQAVGAILVAPDGAVSKVNL